MIAGEPAAQIAVDDEYQQNAGVAFHAALVSRGESGAVIVGPSFAGKSTLATALWKAGWTLMSDDVAIVSASGIATPAPRRVSLRHPSRALVGEELWNRVLSAPSTTETSEGLLFHPHETDGAEQAQSTHVKAFFFLARREAFLAPADIEPMNRAAAALALLPYAINVRDLPFPDAVRVLAPLAESIPAFDLGRGALPDMVAAVERSIG
jgi:hypothetical protein